MTSYTPADDISARTAEDVTNPAEFRVTGRTPAGGYMVRQDYVPDGLSEVPLLNYVVDGFATVESIRWRGYYVPDSGPRMGVPTFGPWQDLLPFKS